MAEHNVPVDVDQLIKEKEALELKVQQLEEKLNKIIHHESKQRYYETHKEEIIKKSGERLKQIKEKNPEKIKEYARRAYLKKKEKLLREK
jgi:hypothetical protein